MGGSMNTITKVSPSKYELSALKDEAKAVFGDRFIDLNEIHNGESLRIYLNDSQQTDDIKFQSVLSSHDAIAVRDASEERKNQKKNKKQEVLTKLKMTEEELKHLLS